MKGGVLMIEKIHVYILQIQRPLNELFLMKMPIYTT